jgi:hypothetical protein
MPGLLRRRCARVGQAIASFALVADAAESMMAGGVTATGRTFS